MLLACFRFGLPLRFCDCVAFVICDFCVQFAWLFVFVYVCWPVMFVLFDGCCVFVLPLT